ncbi:MAG TPA: hypothetical protein VK809_00325 [Bacteroidia bacterium]|jgi:hypothetical protein|nr:hypothetical protein [Bacteroidia bacterium]
MKTSLKIFLLALVLFSSCTMMKRKYMPGYTVQWKSKNSSAQMPQVKKGLPTTKLSPLATNLINIGVSEDNSNKEQSIIDEKRISLKENTNTHQIYSEKLFPTDTLKKPADTSSTVLPIEENAEKSVTNGGFALLSAILSVLLLLVGPGLESGSISLLIVFTAFILLGIFCLMFALNAINSAVKAIKHISKEPGKYSGLGKALEGLILGIICLFYLILIVIAFSAVIGSGAL